MTRHILVKSRSRLCGKLESDIMHYCALNPFKLTKGLRNLFRIMFDKKFFIKRDRLSNIFSKADKKLAKVFNKKRSYYYNILLLKKKIRFFFGVISDSFIMDQLFYILNYKRKVKGLKILDALTRCFEMRLDFISIRLRYCFNLKHARDLVCHGSFSINGLRIFDPFFVVKLGDIILPFNFKYKALVFKSLYLNFFSEYISKSGFIKGVLFKRILNISLFRFRRKIFKKRQKLFKYYYRFLRTMRKSRKMRSLNWISISQNFFFNNKFGLFSLQKSYFFQNIVFFKRFSFFSFFKGNNLKELKYIKTLNIFNRVSPLKFNTGVFIKDFLFNLNSNIFLLQNKNFFIFSFFYFIASIQKFFNYFKFCLLYFRLYFYVRKYFILSKGIYQNKNILKVNLMKNVFFKKLLLTLKFLIYCRFYSFFINLFFSLNINFLQKLNSKKKFFVKVANLNSFKISLLFYYFNSLNAIFTKLKVIPKFKNSSDKYFNYYFFFFFNLRFLKRYFFSFKTSFSSIFFSFFKKIRKLSYIFFLLLLKFKLKSRLYPRKNKLKIKNYRFKFSRLSKVHTRGKSKFRKKNFRKTRFFFRKRSLILLDLLFKKRRMMRFWSVRLIERIFNILQFFQFAIRKRLNFYRLRKREFAFLLMGKNYMTRKKFFKKYSYFNPINYLKFTMFRFNIFIRTRLQRYRKRKFNIRAYIIQRKKIRRKNFKRFLLLSLFARSTVFYHLKRLFIFFFRKRLKKLLIRNKKGFLKNNKK